MQISSSVFQDGEKIPDVYTCRGESINPPLMVEGVPTEAKSLALTVVDPDSPNGPFTHWVLFNINPDIIFIAENTVPEGALQGKNSGGESRYYPSCPVSGEHRYVFKLYALNKMLDLPIGISREKFEESIKDSVLSEAQLTGRVSA